ncbi:hypothetical protein ANI_1_1720134 [Paecilomyces variotii No. 5]|uniref:Uncharacterized protein n=1 Tax=Byssochlamys spectabilis (strain No. 5 / NBRC 109023) TaxID=1356009 RepID=V5I384_BYSSN|nr:hypothetical protein ANI_1_1720134 [Paecilomyces variotii No. 5]
MLPQKVRAIVPQRPTMFCREHPSRSPGEPPAFRSQRQIQLYARLKYGRLYVVQVSGDTSEGLWRKERQQQPANLDEHREMPLGDLWLRTTPLERRCDGVAELEDRYSPRQLHEHPFGNLADGSVQGSIARCLPAHPGVVAAPKRSAQSDSPFSSLNFLSISFSLSLLLRTPPLRSPARKVLTDIHLYTILISAAPSSGSLGRASRLQITWNNNPGVRLPPRQYPSITTAKPNQSVGDAGLIRIERAKSPGNSDDRKEGEYYRKRSLSSKPSRSTAMANEGHTCYMHSGPPHSPQIMDELISKYSSTMSASTSCSSVAYSSANTRRNVVQRMLDRARVQYYRYEVTFGLYVMTPGEKLVANTFVLVFLSLLVWALLLYFPTLLYQKLSRLIWLLTGHDEDVGAVLGAIDSGLHPVTSAFPAAITARAS